VKRSLHQPHPSCSACTRSIHHSLHELPPNAGILGSGVDCNRAYASDHGTLIEAIASNNAASYFGHNTVEAIVSEQRRKDTGGRFRPRKIARETVSPVNAGEGLVADFAAIGTIILRSDANHYFRV
jgi:hypothetical protein